jgi:hypothetical protein
VRAWAGWLQANPRQGKAALGLRGKTGGLEEALAHFAKARDLDASKMPALAHISDAVAGVSGHEALLAGTLALQAKVAAANQNSDNAQRFAAQAAAVFEVLREWGKAREMWERSTPGAADTLQGAP